MFLIAGHSFQVRKLKLGVNDHLMGAGNMGYPDIRKSTFEIFGFFRILSPCGLNFEATMVKLGVNDHLIVTDVSGYPDIHIHIRISFHKGKANAVSHVDQIDPASAASHVYNFAGEARLLPRSGLAKRGAEGGVFASECITCKLTRRIINILCNI